MNDDQLLFRALRDITATEQGRFRFCKAILSLGPAFLANAESLRIAILKVMPYRLYLVTEHWRATAKAAKERAGGKCQLCNSSRDIETHHRTYDRRGHEEEADLTVLCAECHGKFHTKPTPEDGGDPQTFDAEEMRWAGMTEAEETQELARMISAKRASQGLNPTTGETLNPPEKPLSAIMRRKSRS